MMKFNRISCRMLVIAFMLVMLTAPANATASVMVSDAQEIVTPQSVISQGQATKDQMAMNGTNYIRVDYTKYSNGSTRIDGIDRAWSTDGDVQLTDSWVNSSHSSATAVFWDDYHNASYTLTIQSSEIP